MLAPLLLTLMAAITVAAFTLVASRAPSNRSRDIIFWTGAFLSVVQLASGIGLALA